MSAYTIGLTGEIASGKSTVSHWLKKMGPKILDADVVAREVLAQDGRAYGDVITHFGRDYLLEDGEIDRKKLGALVFSNKRELEALNAITHPHIVAEIEEDLHNANGVVIIDAALLFDVGMDALCDEIWVVKAPQHIRKERILKRDKLPEHEALARIRSNKIDLWGYEGVPVYQLENSGTIEEFWAKVEELWQRALARMDERIKLES